MWRGIVMSIGKSAILAILVSFLAGTAHADDIIKHDRKVERAAAERIAGKIGDMRGGASHDADLATLIEMKRKKLPRPMQTGNSAALPPMVMNDLPQGVDTMITGSNKPVK